MVIKHIPADESSKKVNSIDALLAHFQEEVSKNEKSKGKVGSEYAALSSVDNTLKALMLEIEKLESKGESAPSDKKLNHFFELLNLFAEDHPELKVKAARMKKILREIETVGHISPSIKAGLERELKQVGDEIITSADQMIDESVNEIVAESKKGGPNFEDAMASLAMHSSLIQEAFAKFHTKVTDLQAEMSKQTAKSLKGAMNDLKVALKKLLKALHSFWHKFFKGIGIAVAVVGILVGGLTGNPVLAAMSATLLTLSLTGGMKKLESAVATGLDYTCGLFAKMVKKHASWHQLPEKVKEALAKVVITVAVAVTTGGLDSLLSASEAVSEAGSEAAVEAAEEVVEEVTESASHLGRMLDKINALSRYTRVSIAAGASAGASTQPVTAILDASLPRDMKGRAEFLMAIGAVETVLDMIVGAVSMSGLSSKGSSLATNLLVRTAGVVLMGGMAAQGAGSIVQGKELLDQSRMMKDLGELEGKLSVLFSRYDMNTQGTRTSNDTFSSKMKQLESQTQSIADLSKGHQGVAQALSV